MRPAQKAPQIFQVACVVLTNSAKSHSRPFLSPSTSAQHRTRDPASKTHFHPSAMRHRCYFLWKTFDRFYDSHCSASLGKRYCSFQAEHFISPRKMQTFRPLFAHPENKCGYFACPFRPRIPPNLHFLSHHKIKNPTECLLPGKEQRVQISQVRTTCSVAFSLPKFFGLAKWGT